MGHCPRVFVGMRVSQDIHSSELDYPRLLILSRIVEYATREQAQTAVQTLSNQNLMGRLVYVREVGHPPKFVVMVDTEGGVRIEKRNHDLSAQPEAAVATAAECKAATVPAAVLEAVEAVVPTVVVVVVPVAAAAAAVAWVVATARSTCPTFVYSRSFLSRY